MKHITTIIFTTLLVILSGCSKQAFESSPLSRASIKAEIKAPAFSSYEVQWPSDGQLGIFSNKAVGETATSSQIALSLGGESSTTVAFTTEAGWKLMDGTEYNYIAYYPFDVESRRDSVAVSFDGQKQSANGDKSHVWNYTYMYSIPTLPESSASAAFEMKHISAMADFKLSVPAEYSSTSFSEMSVESNDVPFIRKAWYDVSSIVRDARPTIVSASYSNSLELTLDGIAPSDNVIDAWMMMLPAELDGKTLTVSLLSQDSTFYLKGSVTVSGNQTAGGFYEYTATLSKVERIFTDADCVKAVVEQMNVKAASLGMTNSTWRNPSGLLISGTTNETTARDMCKMLMAAYRYPSLRKVWADDNAENEHKYTLTLADGDKITVTSTVTSPSLENYYEKIGGKTGHITGHLALVIITKINGELVAGAIMDATGEDARFVAMRELFDAGKMIMNGEDPGTTAVTKAQYACAYKFYEDESKAPEVLYEQGADTKTAPASTSKVMSTITALDYIADLDKYESMHKSDLVSGSGAVFKLGDKVRIIELLYASMYPSSNQAATAIGRIAGREILNSKISE